MSASSFSVISDADNMPRIPRSASGEDLSKCLSIKTASCATAMLCTQVPRWRPIINACANAYREVPFGYSMKLNNMGRRYEYRNSVCASGGALRT